MFSIKKANNLNTFNILNKNFSEDIHFEVKNAQSM